MRITSFLAALLMTALLLTGLTGCSRDESTDQNGGTTTSTTETTTTSTTAATTATTMPTNVTTTPDNDGALGDVVDDITGNTTANN